VLFCLHSYGKLVNPKDKTMNEPPIRFKYLGHICHMSTKQITDIYWTLTELYTMGHGHKSADYAISQLYDN